MYFYIYQSVTSNNCLCIYHHDITEILLKVVLNSITLTSIQSNSVWHRKTTIKIMVSAFPNHATLIWRYVSFYLCTTIVAYSNPVALLWRCGNKNVDIKFNAHDAFSGITFIRYTHIRKVGKPNNLKSWEQVNQMA